MKLKRIITLSASLLVLMGIGMASVHVPAHAGQPGTAFRYTNGKYNYYYTGNSKMYTYHGFGINAKSHKKKLLPKKYQKNTEMAIISQANYNQNHITKHELNTPQVLPVHHHNYVYVLGVWKDNREGHIIEGYMNPRDFSAHKAKTHKHYHIIKRNQRIKNRNKNFVKKMYKKGYRDGRTSGILGLNFIQKYKYYHSYNHGWIRGYEAFLHHLYRDSPKIDTAHNIKRNAVKAFKGCIS